MDVLEPLPAPPVAENSEPVYIGGVPAAGEVADGQGDIWSAGE